MASLTLLEYQQVFQLISVIRLSFIKLEPFTMYFLFLLTILLVEYDIVKYEAVYMESIGNL